MELGCWMSINPDAHSPDALGCEDGSQGRRAQGACDQLPGPRTLPITSQAPNASSADLAASREPFCIAQKISPSVRYRTDSSTERSSPRWRQRGNSEARRCSASLFAARANLRQAPRVAPLDAASRHPASTYRSSDHSAPDLNRGPPFDLGHHEARRSALRHRHHRSSAPHSARVPLPRPVLIGD